MKMILFRPTFVAAWMMLQLVPSCIFPMTVSAVPQFGRPSFRVLDEQSPSAGNISDQAGVATPLVPPPTPAVQIDAENTAVSSSSAVATPSSTPSHSSGASHMGDGAHTALFLGAAASTLLLVF